MKCKICLTELKRVTDALKVKQKHPYKPKITARVRSLIPESKHVFTFPCIKMQSYINRVVNRLPTHVECSELLTFLKMVYLPTTYTHTQARNHLAHLSQSGTQ